MVFEGAGREPLPQRAHAMADVLGREVLESHVADHVGAGLDPAGARTVRGRLDAGPVVRKPTVRVVNQIRAFASRQQASALQFGQLRLVAFSCLGLGMPLCLDDAAPTGGGVLAQLLAEMPDAVLVLEHAA